MFDVPYITVSGRSSWPSMFTSAPNMDDGGIAPSPGNIGSLSNWNVNGRGKLPQLGRFAAIQEDSYLSSSLDLFIGSSIHIGAYGHFVFDLQKSLCFLNL